MRTRIGEIANRLLDEVVDDPHFDVMEAYARPLPTIVIAEMLGVDETDQHDFKRWLDAQGYFFSPARTPEQQTSLEWGRDALGAISPRWTTSVVSVAARISSAP
jgi:cytochrome P450